MTGLKTHLDLFFIILFFGKPWKFMPSKITALCSLNVFLKLSAASRAKNKNLTDFICIDRKIVLFSVLDCNDQLRSYIQSGLLLYFASSVLSPILTHSL